MAGPRKKQTSPYDAPRDVLRSDMPEGFSPESRATPPASPYPMLRAMRWILRVAAGIYFLVSLAQAANALGFFDVGISGRSDERAVTYPDGTREPDRMERYMAIMIGFGAVKGVVFAMALLALAEAIQLGLDVRAQQERARG